MAPFSALAMHDNGSMAMHTDASPIGAEPDAAVRPSRWSEIARRNVSRSGWSRQSSAALSRIVGGARIMRMSLVCFVLAVSASAAPMISITETNCSGCATAGPYFASVNIPARPSLYASASAIFRDDYLFTVNEGPDQGFFGVCFDGYVSFVVSGAAFGMFAGQGSRQVFPGRVSPIGGCGYPTLTAFRRGVAIESAMILRADASVNAPSPGDLGASTRVSLSGFRFYDAAMNPASGVTYTLVEANPVPEPATSLLAVFALLLEVGRRLACARLAAIEGKWSDVCKRDRRSGAVLPRSGWRYHVRYAAGRRS